MSTTNLAVTSPIAISTGTDQLMRIGRNAVVAACNCLRRLQRRQLVPCIALRECPIAMPNLLLARARTTVPMDRNCRQATQSAFSPQHL
jgi:hypothetical protein